MKKKRSRAHHPGPVRDTPRAEMAAAARRLEEALSADDHGVGVILEPVIAVDGDDLLRRDSVLDQVRRVVWAPIADVRVIGVRWSWADDLGTILRTFYPRTGPNVDEATVDSLVHAYTVAVENLIGPVRFAAQVETRPEGDYANVWTDIVLISRTHAARLALTVID